MPVLGWFLILYRRKVVLSACTRRIHDALLTRLSNDDDMERSLSTFANEMTSSAMILGSNLYLLRLHTSYAVNGQAWRVRAR